MKKLCAALLAWVMLLSGVGALAESAADTPDQETLTDPMEQLPAVARADSLSPALRTQISYTLSSELLSLLAEERLNDSPAGRLIRGALYVLQNGYLDVVSGREGMSVSLMINQKPVVTFKGQLAEDCVLLFSDLFPSHVIQISYNAMATLAGLLRLPITLETPDGSGAAADDAPEAAEEADGAAQEQLQRAAQRLTPYWDDVLDFVQSVARTNRISEDLNSMNMALSAGQVNHLVESLLGRLGRDTRLLAWAQGLVDQINTVLDPMDQLTVEGLAADILGSVQQACGTSDRVLATIETNRSENGRGTIEVDALDQLAVTYDVVPNGEVITVLLGDGGNGSDVAVAGETQQFFNHSVSAPGLGVDAVTRQITASAAAEPVMPDLTGLQVVDLRAMALSERMSFMADLLTNGISALLADLVRAVPDGVARLVEAGFGRSGGSADTAARLAPAIDQMEGPVDLTSRWNTADGYLEMRGDGTCTLFYQNNAYQATYMCFDGVLFLTCDTASMTGSYTQDKLTLNIGFDTVEFTR